MTRGERQSSRVLLCAEVPGDEEHRVTLAPFASVLAALSTLPAIGANVQRALQSSTHHDSCCIYLCPSTSEPVQY
jgi:hypothetical protein